jgi:hypothetical protein
MSVPHPDAFSRAMLSDPEQQAAIDEGGAVASGLSLSTAVGRHPAWSPYTRIQLYKAWRDARAALVYARFGQWLIESGGLNEEAPSSTGREPVLPHVRQRAGRGPGEDGRWRGQFLRRCSARRGVTVI